jgi:hypothetical protein
MIGCESVAVRVRADETTVFLLPDFRRAVVGAKKINIVPGFAQGEQYEVWWPTSFRPPHVDDGHDLHPQDRLPLAGRSAAVRSMADGLRQVAIVVRERCLGFGGTLLGPESDRQAEVCRCQPSEGSSGRLRRKGRQTGPAHRVHQGRGEHETSCRRGREGPVGAGGVDGGTGQRCEDRPGVGERIGRMPGGGGQRLRQPYHAGGRGALGQPELHPAAERQHGEGRLSQGLVSEPARGGEFLPADQAHAADRDALRQAGDGVHELHPVGCNTRLDPFALSFKTRPTTCSPVITATARKPSGGGPLRKASP